MMIPEYKVTQFAADDCEKLTEHLNRMVKEGWSLFKCQEINRDGAEAFILFCVWVRYPVQSETRLEFQR